jgi:hypothetical protein
MDTAVVPLLLATNPRRLSLKPGRFFLLMGYSHRTGTVFFFRVFLYRQR